MTQESSESSSNAAMQSSHTEPDPGRRLSHATSSRSRRMRRKNSCHRADHHPKSTIKSTILGMQLVVNLRGLLLGCFVLNDWLSAIARSRNWRALALSEKSKKIKSLQQGSCNILTRSQDTCHNQFRHLGTVSSLPALSQLYVVSGFLSQLSQDRPPEPVVYSLMWPGQSLWLRVVKLGWLGSFLYIPLPEVE